MPDPIREHFGYGQLWPLWPACSQDWAGSYLPDLTSHILFSSVFPKETWIILYKADPDLIWMACQGLAKCIWSGSKSMCRNHLAWFLAGCYRPATSFPFSDSVPFFHRWPGSYCAKTSQDMIWFWLTVSGFGQRDPVRKQASVQQSSDPLLANASQPIWIGYESVLACLLG